jgi:hypothetical protein
MQHCGICSVLSDAFRRIMCIGGSRRGSGDSYYQELDEGYVSSCCLYLLSTTETMKAVRISFDRHITYGDHDVRDLCGVCVRLRVDLV